MMSTKACSEKIIWDISEAINNEIELELNDAETFNDPDLIDENLVESKILCDKLLNYNYFEESEALLDSMIENKKCDKRNRWESIYNRELKEKKRDMRRLFNLIVDYSEDWC